MIADPVSQQMIISVTTYVDHKAPFIILKLQTAPQGHYLSAPSLCKSGKDTSPDPSNDENKPRLDLINPTSTEMKSQTQDYTKKLVMKKRKR